MDSCMFRSPIGMLEICEEGERITKLALKPDGAMRENGRRRNGLLYEACRQLSEYFAGKRKAFDLPLDCRGTAFQQRVWMALRDIPYGETRSYQEIAIQTGNKKAVRAVGGANNKNPVMILVPCHRVIHKNGSLGGFGCGAEIKEYLLRLERNNR